MDSFAELKSLLSDLLGDPNHDSELFGQRLQRFEILCNAVGVSSKVLEFVRNAVGLSSKAANQPKLPQKVSRKAKRKNARKAKSKAAEATESDSLEHDEHAGSAASNKKRPSKTKVAASSTKKTAVRDDHVKVKKEKERKDTGPRTGTETAPVKESTTDQPSADNKRLKRKRGRKLPKATMLQTLRKYEAAKVKIPKERSQWTREIADTLLEYIRKYLKENSKPEFFSHLEYTGSFYENLKTGDADEIDIILALDTKDNAYLEIEEVNLPGYARIKATSKTSKYWGKKGKKIATGDGYIKPKKILDHFFSLVQRAVNTFKKEIAEGKAVKTAAREIQSGIDVKKLTLKVRDNGPAITLVIKDTSTENTNRLSVDLVPAFLFKEKKAAGAHHGEATYYVAKTPLEEMTKKHQLPEGCTREMLWRRSFSLDEKRKMQKLDKDDKSCRRAVIKILKTVVKSDATLAKLTSFHIKTAFLHYNFDEDQAKLEWSNEKLQERFQGLMQYLLDRVRGKHLANFFVPTLNLLEELSDSNLINIGDRLKKLIENENELRKILFVEASELKPNKTTKSLKPTAKKRKIT